ncbi:MAG: hypothetical protein A3J07_04915 [Candidatus Doudnabacteria bacterium RIFCSPLOWO2_02_FULL_49_13]|uniref:N-acetyltransferase domain-containing protein n=1 Tax=Candidatus Doudnabacteria bacterium RIFCSPHIGHO2_12_FULL_48_16 TaxID=1817838 RepID=A0A1F5PLA8_9BACT|nr:MAG: hypothetical protein A3B77_04555 [Candidatus Doudnabacteria bacterium RIFCSPHIGHO2_02_FULL_49_24]OGE88161.1 MAG: hypothetical protein A2760_02205 [Candidatus Doudnabacteria bacterium RIFCSPHIGHO2_01_FULL_50_67]OGE90470.1 MAG: hypothetical protein A3E29_04985 [Candidatus Doudnabacteria bacterium RIFCSPHIGHO2_12_FULL_48_16]OGE96532.1 MAG: hypothetical protein A2990_03430 [Candidatus Doudnabacteria bacterium RIFCSPLOWO2_01_FULL_49_40]OGF02706.1 MAG: hypothetical protein A3J07_04915 [Candid
MKPGNSEQTPADVRNPQPVNIVQLSPDQWTILRDMKLRSLEQEPIAFEDPVEARKKYLTRPEAVWREILSGKIHGGRKGASIYVFAQDPSAPEKYAGMVSAIIPETRQARKLATVQSMYVDAEGYRGQGIGKKLLADLLEKLKARGDVGKVELQVVVTQGPAIALYKSLGFEITQTLYKAAKRGDEEYDEYQMEKELE